MFTVSLGGDSLFSPYSDEASDTETLRNRSQGEKSIETKPRHSRPPLGKPAGRTRVDSFGESLSTIPTADSSAEVKQVYRELQDINEQLKVKILVASLAIIAM